MTSKAFLSEDTTTALYMEYLESKLQNILPQTGAGIKGELRLTKSDLRLPDLSAANIIFS